MIVLDGLVCLLLVRFLLPSHRFLRTLCSQSLYHKARATFRPELFSQAEQNAARLELRDVPTRAGDERADRDRAAQRPRPRQGDCQHFMTRP